MDQREQTIQLAIEEFNSGVFTSIRATARAHGVPEATIRRRLSSV